MKRVALGRSYREAFTCEVIRIHVAERKRTVEQGEDGF